MIKTIKISEKDKISLERILNKNEIKQNPQPIDYRDMVVIKPWGYEFLAYENEHIAMWFLHIKHGHSTSMHCHPNKKTCLMVMSGNAICNTFHLRNHLGDISGVVIDESVFHSTKALSSQGINLIEIETPPNKTDLVRLSDEYGRAMEGYESFSEMRKENLDRYNYCYYAEEDAIGMTKHKIGEQILAYESYINNEDFQDNFKIDVDGIYSAGRGVVFTGDNEPFIGVGSIVSGEALVACEQKTLHIKEKTVLIKIAPNN